MSVGPPEILLVLLVLLLLFGAKKLPELARGSGRALRIFKAETKGLMDDDEDEEPAKPEKPRVLEVESKTETLRYDTPTQETHPETER